MAEPQLNVTIQPDGSVSIEVSGVTGTACTELTRQLEEALGGEITDRVFRDSYYQQSDDQQIDLGQHG